MDPKELTDQISDLMAGAYAIEETLREAAEGSPEHDTDYLEIYEAAESIGRAQPALRDAQKRIATFVGTKALAGETVA